MELHRSKHAIAGTVVSKAYDKVLMWAALRRKQRLCFCCTLPCAHRASGQQVPRGLHSNCLDDSNNYDPKFYISVYDVPGLRNILQGSGKLEGKGMEGSAQLQRTQAVPGGGSSRAHTGYERKSLHTEPRTWGATRFSIYEPSQQPIGCCPTEPKGLCLRWGFASSV
eukprot:357076-Chlamydomonas_euryale.AAC.8